MRNVFLKVIFLLFFLNVSAQDYTEQALSIRSPEKAKAFADSLPMVHTAFMHADVKDQEYINRMKELQPGDTYKTGNYQVVIVAEGKKELYRFRSIVLTKHKTNDAKNLAEKIFRQLQSGESFEQLFDAYAENKTPGIAASGDLGWIDPDFFDASFKKELIGKSKGDQYLISDAEQGWFNIIEVTHNPKESQGHHILFYPDVAPSTIIPKVNHEKNIAKLKTSSALRNYAKNHPAEVSLQLFNKAGNRTIFERISAEKSVSDKNQSVVIDDNASRFLLIKDTTVELFSIQYVYLNGAELSRDKKNEIIHDIYDQFHSGVKFDSIVTQYWPDNDGRSVLRNIEGSLLAEDLVAKVRSTTVGQLFVARVGQSYFLGVPLEKPKKVDAFLMLSYPKPSEP